MAQPLFAIFVLLCCVSAFAQDGPESDIHSTLKEFVDSGEFKGAVVGLLAADGTQKVIAYGDAGDDAVSLDAHSVFEIGSITKVFTGILLADMVNRGEVSLSDPLSKFLPDSVTVPERNNKAITLLDLATHHSGLPSFPTNLIVKDHANFLAHYTLQDLYDFLSSYELIRAPGEQFEYSNVGVGLLGHALALSAGQPFEDLLQERVLRPLGMTSTGITLSPLMQKHLVQGHSGLGEPVPSYKAPTFTPAGGLRSTMHDLLIFANANMSNSDTPINRALRGAQKIRRKVNSMGLGLNWRVDAYAGHTILFHEGQTNGFETYLGIDILENRAAIVLTNSASFSRKGRLGFHLLDSSIGLGRRDGGNVLAGNYIEGGIKSVIKHFHFLRKEKPSKYNINESSLARIGDWLLEKGLHDEAIEILRLNIEIYPESAFSYSLLGESLRTAGRTEEAQKAFSDEFRLAEELQ